jgi:hypothetical protein
MARDNGIISLGNEWYLYPPQFWGRGTALGRLQLSRGRPATYPSWRRCLRFAPGWFRSKPRRARVDARSAAVDRILGDLGIR